STVQWWAGSTAPRTMRVRVTPGCRVRVVRVSARPGAPRGSAAGLPGCRVSSADAWAGSPASDTARAVPRTAPVARSLFVNCTRVTLPPRTDRDTNSHLTHGGQVLTPSVTRQE